MPLKRALSCVVIANQASLALALRAASLLEGKTTRSPFTKVILVVIGLETGKNCSTNEIRVLREDEISIEEAKMRISVAGQTNDFGLLLSFVPTIADDIEHAILDVSSALDLESPFLAIEKLLNETVLCPNYSIKAAVDVRTVLESNKILLSTIFSRKVRSRLWSCGYWLTGLSLCVGVVFLFRKGKK